MFGKESGKSIRVCSYASANVVPIASPKVERNQASELGRMRDCMYGASAFVFPFFSSLSISLNSFCRPPGESEYEGMAGVAEGAGVCCVSVVGCDGNCCAKAAGAMHKAASIKGVRTLNVRR